MKPDPFYGFGTIVFIVACMTGLLALQMTMIQRPDVDLDLRGMASSQPEANHEKPTIGASDEPA